MEERADIAIRVQLRDPNEAIMATYREVYAPRVHARRPPQLGHDPRERFPPFFV
jgi:hypothetical protein